jgi:hypothetical protein
MSYPSGRSSLSQRPHRARSITLLGALLFGGISACGEGTGPAVQGSFSATLSGDRTGTLSGTAVFGVESVGGSTGFVIGLERGSVASLDVDVILFGRFNTQRPTAGTYNVVVAGCQTCDPNDFDAGYVFQRPNGDSGFFGSESGTITVNTSTADTVAGSSTFTVTELGQGGGTVTIQLSFTAVPGDAPVVPGG